jgi:hypothetical protein
MILTLDCNSLKIIGDACGSAAKANAYKQEHKHNDPGLLASIQIFPADIHLARN